MAVSVWYFQILRQFVMLLFDRYPVKFDVFRRCVCDAVIIRLPKIRQLM